MNNSDRRTSFLTGIWSVQGSTDRRALEDTMQRLQHETAQNFCRLIVPETMAPCRKKALDLVAVNHEPTMLECTQHYTEAALSRVTGRVQTTIPHGLQLLQLKSCCNDTQHSPKLPV